jgi:monofunctional biosynthetic peptidoglycan transglycosylase
MVPDVSVLKAQYPVVKYLGPEKPPSVSIQKNRPPQWTSLGEISKAAIGAIVVSEDWAFYQHKGYDTNQIREALKEDIEQGKFARGASTITQQVARNVFLDKDKNIVRKLKEFYLAVRLEDAVGKKKILESYLNIAEWGEGIFGIRNAAHFYFDKSPSELTAKEGAFLAMLLPSPKRYSQSFRAKRLTDYARDTVEDILNKMVQARYLAEDQLEVEKTRKLSWELSDDIPPAGAL